MYVLLIVFVIVVIYALVVLIRIEHSVKKTLREGKAQEPVRMEALDGTGTYKVVLYEVPQEVKLQAIKIIYDYRGGGLKESKDLSENLPKTIATGLSSYEAMMLQSKFLEIHCKSEVEKE